MTPCKCRRLRFPHRYQAQCDDYIYAARELEQQGRSEADRLYWEDYHDRVRDLRADGYVLSGATKVARIHDGV